MADIRQEIQVIKNEIGKKFQRGYGALIDKINMDGFLRHILTKSKNNVEFRKEFLKVGYEEATEYIDGGDQHSDLFLEVLQKYTKVDVDKWLSGAVKELYNIASKAIERNVKFARPQGNKILSRKALNNDIFIKEVDNDLIYIPQNGQCYKMVVIYLLKNVCRVLQPEVKYEQIYQQAELCRESKSGMTWSSMQNLMRCFKKFYEKVDVEVLNFEHMRNFQEPKKTSSYCIGIITTQNPEEEVIKVDQDEFVIPIEERMSISHFVLFKPRKQKGQLLDAYKFGYEHIMQCYQNTINAVGVPFRQLFEDPQDDILRKYDNKLVCFTTKSLREDEITQKMMSNVYVFDLETVLNKKNEQCVAAASYTNCETMARVFGDYLIKGSERKLTKIDEDSVYYIRIVMLINRLCQTKKLGGHLEGVRFDQLINKFGFANRKHLVQQIQKLFIPDAEFKTLENYEYDFISKIFKTIEIWEQSYFDDGQDCINAVEQGMVKIKMSQNKCVLLNKEQLQIKLMVKRAVYKFLGIIAQDGTSQARDLMDMILNRINQSEANRQINLIEELMIYRNSATILFRQLPIQKDGKLGRKFRGDFVRTFSVSDTKPTEEEQKDGRLVNVSFIPNEIQNQVITQFLECLVKESFYRCIFNNAGSTRDYTPKEWKVDWEVGSREKWNKALGIALDMSVPESEFEYFFNEEIMNEFDEQTQVRAVFQKNILVAHNSQGFDNKFLFDVIMQGKTKCFIIDKTYKQKVGESKRNYSFYSIVFHKEEISRDKYLMTVGVIRFDQNDTAVFIQGGLDSLCKQLKVPKLWAKKKIDFGDYGKLEHCIKNSETWLDYLRNDVIALSHITVSLMNNYIKTQQVIGKKLHEKCSQKAMPDYEGFLRFEKEKKEKGEGNKKNGKKEKDGDYLINFLECVSGSNFATMIRKYYTYKVDQPFAKSDQKTNMFLRQRGSRGGRTHYHRKKYVSETWQKFRETRGFDENQFVAQLYNMQQTAKKQFEKGMFDQFLRESGVLLLEDIKDQNDPMLLKENQKKLIVMKDHEGESFKSIAYPLIFQAWCKGKYDQIQEIFRLAQLEDFCASFDFNSLYPSAMTNKEFKYPDVKSGKVLDKNELVEFLQAMQSVETLERKLNGCQALFEVDWYAPEDLVMIPVVPRYPGGLQNGYLAQHLGYAYRQILTSVELIDALRFGRYQIRKIYDGIVFTKCMEDPFEFISDFYELRKEARADGQPELADMIKRIMNSSYGVLIMKVREKMRQLVKKDQKVVLKEGQKVTIYEQYESHNIITRDNNRDMETPYLLGMFILAYSKRLMNRMIGQIDGFFKPVIAYGDTDSVYTMDLEASTKLMNSPQNGGELQQFKCEKIIAFAVYAMQKSYMTVSVIPKPLCQAKKQAVTEMRKKGYEITGLCGALYVDVTWKGLKKSALSGENIKQLLDMTDGKLERVNITYTDPFKKKGIKIIQDEIPKTFKIITYYDEYDKQRDIWKFRVLDEQKSKKIFELNAVCFNDAWEQVK